MNNKNDNRNSDDDIRSGCVDIWNAFMVEGAEFVLGSDIPVCPCTASEPPKALISYVQAKHIHKQQIKINPDYHYDAFIHFYIDDQKFDGPRKGIWKQPFDALDIIRHFSGAITPDFSTYADFPDPINRYNTYRMRAFGRWLGENGIPIINNVRWGDEETWDYCFDGIPYNSMVAIGTVASGIKLLKNRPIFEKGLFRMIDCINPNPVIIFGSSNYEYFKKLTKQNKQIITFPSDTSIAFSSRKGGHKHEQAK